MTASTDPIVAEIAQADARRRLSFRAAFAITWIVLAARMGAPAIFIAFGLFFIATVLLGGFRSLAKARAYQRDRRSYVARRQSLLRD